MDCQNWFYFLVLLRDVPVILKGRMIFLLPCLVFTKMSFSTVSFLFQLDSRFSLTQAALILKLIGIFHLWALFNPFQPGAAFHIATSHWLGLQSKWMVSEWIATLGWNWLINFYVCFSSLTSSFSLSGHF